MQKCTCEAGKVGYNSQKMLYTVSLAHSGKVFELSDKPSKQENTEYNYKRKILLSGLWCLY